MLDTEPRSEKIGAQDGGAPREVPLPVLMVLHQPHSTTGRIGVQLQGLGYALDVRRPSCGDPLPETLEAHSGAVIFGGPVSANDGHDFVRLETEWIKVPLLEKKPLLGICLGGQMLARHLGARVWEHPERVEIGYLPLRWLTHAQGPDLVYQWHREGFELPGGATALAASEGPFPNQAFSYGDSAVGVQFHPEITYAMVSRWSGRNHPRMSMPGAQDRASQLADHIAHAPAVHRWLDEFLPSWLAGGPLAVRE
jgi:GMP synthase (glutamine-hydrolysing)